MPVAIFEGTIDTEADEDIIEGIIEGSMCVLDGGEVLPGLSIIVVGRNDLDGNADGDFDT